MLHAKHPRIYTTSEFEQLCATAVVLVNDSKKFGRAQTFALVIPVSESEFDVLVVTDIRAGSAECVEVQTSLSYIDAVMFAAEVMVRENERVCHAD